MKDGMKNGYFQINVRFENISSLIMGDAESDEHLRIFKCLIDTGSHVLRNAIGIKLLNNNSIRFVQYLENNKHQFYHQFEKNISRKCCLGSPHGCIVNGIMDKKIFYKVYNKTAKQNTQGCLDRFEIKAGISLDILDLSDLNFFLWNSGTLSKQEEKLLMKIMSIRSAICHPSSSHSYSINELEGYWSDLKSAVLLFAEPKCYKDIVEMQIETLQNCKLNVIESAKIIQKMKTESDKILHAIQQDTPLKIVDIEKLVKDGNYELENCVRSENNKTKSYINNTFQGFKENIEKHHQVLSTRCREEIQTTVTQESSNTRLHSEDQRRAIDSKLTESEQRVCQTVIKSRGHLEDKINEQQNEIRRHIVELNADLMEENRKLTAEVMEMKTDMKELKTIFIGHVGKQNVDLVMNTEQIEKSTNSPDNRKVDITVKVNQTHVTEDKENKIIENLPPEIKILTNNNSSTEAAVTETIEITGKKVNSIVLELKATPGILHSVETFKAAMLTLVQNIQTAGGIDVDIEDTVTLNLRFESPLTEAQIAVVECLFAKEWNNDNNTNQLSTEYSSTPDKYLSSGGVKEMEFRPELDTYSQKGLQEENSKLKHVVKGLQEENSKLKHVVKGLQEENSKLKHVVKGLQMENSQLKGLQEENSKMKHVVKGLQMENSQLKGLQEENSKLKHVVKGLQKENSKLKGLLVQPRRDNTGMISVTKKLGMKQKELKGVDLNSLQSEQKYGLQGEDSKLRGLVKPRPDDTGMISITGKLGIKQKELKSDDFSSLESEQTYGLHDDFSKLREEFRTRQKELNSDYIRSLEPEQKYDLLKIPHQNTSMTSNEEKGRMRDKEYKSVISSQKSELISDFDTRDLETMAKMKLMKLQPSQVPGPGLDQQEEAKNSYTKTEEQKGLAIILHRHSKRHFLHLRDAGIPHLQEFFEEMGFVVKDIVDNDIIQLYRYMSDRKFYCVFIVLTCNEDYTHMYLLPEMLSVRAQGIPIIVMSNSMSYETRTIHKIPDTLVVSPLDLSRDPFHGEYNIFDDFMKVTLSNRFADIMDILTRINVLHDLPVITFWSTLRKKFCFL